MNKPDQTQALSRYLKPKMSALAGWCEKRIDPAALVRFALADYSKNEKLQQCSPASIYLALVACAQVGLEPGGVMQHAFIVPYKKEATFQLGYRGAIELANRSPLIDRVGANVVYENDDFDYDIGSSAYVRHKPATSDRGDMIGAYAFAKFRNGEIDVEWMPLADLEKVRASGHGGPAWTNWADQMHRKAPIRRLCKRLPLSRAAALAFKLDGEAEAGDVGAYRSTLTDTGAIVADPADRSGTTALKQAIRP